MKTLAHINNSCDVLFINPTGSKHSSEHILIEPIDTLSLASFCESVFKSHIFSLLDMDLYKIPPEQLAQWHFSNLKAVVVVADYHIPLHDQGVRVNIEKIFAHYKTLGVSCILVGKSATFEAQEAIRSLHADFCCSFEAEYALRSILSNVLGVQKTPFLSCGSKSDNSEGFTHHPKAPPVQLDELVFANRNLVNVNDYIDTRTILSSRGCNLKCEFCHVPSFWGAWRSRSAQHVVAEIKELLDMGHKKILFLDDNALASSKRAMQLCEQISSMGLSDLMQGRAAMGALATIFKSDQATLKNLYEHGMRWIHFGAESADNEVLQSIKKKMSIEDFQRTTEAALEMGYRLRSSWIVDLPGVSEQSMKRTLDFISTAPTQEIRIHFLSLRRGSEFYKKYVSGRDSESLEQFIHTPRQNQNLTLVGSKKVQDMVEQCLLSLVQKGYQVVTECDSFGQMQKDNQWPQKVVSLCPMRYGMRWL